MDTIPTQPPIVYTVAEAAVISRLSRSTLYELIASGELRSVKVGRRRLVPASALTQLLDPRDSAA